MVLKYFIIALFVIIGTFSVQGIGYIGYLTNNDSNISLYFNESAQGYRAHIFAPYDLSSFAVELDSNNITLQGNEIRRQGLYRFFLENATNRFPDHGFIYFFLTDSDPRFYNATINYGTNDSTNADCSMSGTVCDREMDRVGQITRLSAMYHFLGNISYLDYAYSFLISDWKTFGTCNPYVGNFNCVDSIEMDGPAKQGVIITSLLDSYSLNRNKSFLDYAYNFLNSSTTHCDVWNDDFDCTGTNSQRSGENQGRLIAAYAKAYMHTGDSRYYGIFTELLDVALTTSYDSSIGIIAGLSEAYFMTNNETVRIHAEKYLLDFLEDFQFDEVYANAEILWYAPYIVGFNTSQTESYASKLNQILTISEDILNECGDFTCSYDISQIRLSLASFYVMKRFYDSPLIFFNPQYSNNDSHHLVSVSFTALPTNPYVFYRTGPGSFSNASIVSGNVAISRMQDTPSFVFEYYFQDGLTRYPMNGSFKSPVPIDIQNNRLTNFINAAPIQGCNPLVGDFSCRYEWWQGDYLQGLARVARDNSSLDSSVRGLATSKIDPDEIYATCDPAIDDFFCTSNIFDSEPKATLSGIVRAMPLAKSYKEAHSILGDHTPIKNLLSFVYLSNSSVYSSCNIWHNDYDCSSEETYLYMHGIRAAYDSLGDENLYFSLEQLYDSLYSKDPDIYVIAGLIDFFDLFGNQSSKTTIEDELDLKITECLNSCSVTDFYFTLDSLWKSYKLFENPEVYLEGLELAGVNPNGFRRYCTGSDAQSYSCTNPSDQSMAIQAYFSMKENYIQREPVNFSVNISLNLSSNPVYETTLGSFINASCYVLNQGNNPASAVLLMSTPLQSPINSIALGSIDPNSSRAGHFLVQADRVGRQTLSCGVQQYYADTFVDIYFTDPIFNLSQLNSLANKENNYTLNFSLLNNFSFPVDDVFISLENISAHTLIANITSNFDEFTWNQSGISINRIFAQEYFNFSIKFMPVTSFSGNITLPLSSAYNGSNSFDFFAIIDYDSFAVSAFINTSPYIYQSTYGFIEINNTKNRSLTNLSVLVDYGEMNVSELFFITNGTIIENDSIVISTFDIFEIFQIYFNFSTSNQSNISIIFAGDDLYELVRLPVVPKRDILEIEINDMQASVGSTVNTIINVSNIIIVNQTLGKLFLNYSGINITGISVPFDSVFETMLFSNFTVDNQSEEITNGLLIPGTSVNLSSSINISVYLPGYIHNVTFSFFNTSIPLNSTVQATLRAADKSQDCEVYGQNFNCTLSGIFLNETTTLEFIYNPVNNQNYSLDFLEISAIHENRTYLATYEQNESTLLFNISNLTINRSYAFPVNFTFISEARIYANITSSEGGYFETIASIFPIVSSSGSSGGNSGLGSSSFVVNQDTNDSEFTSTEVVSVYKFNYSFFIDVLETLNFEHTKNELDVFYSCIPEFRRRFQNTSNSTFFESAVNLCDFPIQGYFIYDLREHVVSDVMYDGSRLDSVLESNFYFGEFNLLPKENFSFSYVSEDELPGDLFLLFPKSLEINEVIEQVPTYPAEKDSQNPIIIVVLVLSTMIGYIAYQKFFKFKPVKIIEFQENIVKFGLRLAYLDELVRAGNVIKAKKEFAALRSDLDKYREIMRAADVQAQKIMQQQIITLRRIYVTIKDLSSQSKTHIVEEFTPEENLFEYDLYLQIRASNAELKRGKIFAAETILNNAKMLLDRLEDDDLHGQKSYFQLQIEYAFDNLKKYQSTSLFYKIARLFRS